MTKRRRRIRRWQIGRIAQRLGVDLAGGVAFRFMSAFVVVLLLFLLAYLIKTAIGVDLFPQRHLADMLLE